METTLPPGPGTSSLLQRLAWTYRPFSFMEENGKAYGDMFTARMSGMPASVLISDPETIKQVFTAEPDLLDAGRANVIVKPLVGERSVLLLDGPRHTRERKLMMPPFHGERMQSYADVMRAATDEVVGRWRSDAPFQLHSQMQEITLEVIIRAVFGMGDGEQLQTLRDRLRRLLDIGANSLFLLFFSNDSAEEITPQKLKWYQRALGPLSPWVRWVELKEEVDRLLMGEIRRRRDSGAMGEDILSLLLSARDEAGAAMTDEELHNEMMTLVVAGHETTATALTSVMFQVLSHPEVLARMEEELAKVVGDGPLTAKHVSQLEYLDAVTKEGQRLNPVLPMVARVLRRPARFGNFDLPAGTVVCPCIYLTHRRPDLYPEPERFNPDRFLERKPGPYEYFPFGGGNRRCIGMAFAQFEMKVVLAEVLLRARLKLPQGYRGRMVRRGITFCMSEGLPVLLEQRRDAKARAAA
jgi:cytochrome P450 family 110